MFQIKDEIETVEMDQESWDQNKDYIQDELIRTELQKMPTKNSLPAISRYGW